MTQPTTPIAPADAAARLLSGGRLAPPEALHLLQHAPRGELRDAAHRVTAAYAPRRFDFCGTGLRLCASVGLLAEDDLRRLRDAGLRRVHCNLETAPSLFPALCTTHTQEQKLATLRAARRAGLEICCGGIVGMGETDEQLVEFAYALAAVAPDSIPVNILHPIPGTPLGTLPPPAAEHILDAVCILRLANLRTPLRFAGGRTLLDDATARLAIHCGIDAGIAGYLLTTPGASYADDRALASEAGYKIGPA